MTKPTKLPTKKTPTAKQPPPVKASTARRSKQAMLVNLLERPAGATIEEMVKITGWQHHSVRGVLSGVLKKKMGLQIHSAQEERGRIYRISA